MIAASPVKTMAIAPDRSRFMLMWELPFWAALTYWAFMPATLTPWWDVMEMPVSSKEVFLIAAALLYLFGSLALSRQPVTRRDWHHNLPWWTLAIMGYAALSTAWSEMDQRNTDAMIYTLITAASAVVLGYALVSRRTAEETEAFLWRLAMYLAWVGLVYFSESFFDLGLRTSQAADAGDFGISRTCGPMFASSTGYFILLPALAVAIHHVVERHGGRLVGVVAALILAVALLGLGSRAGLLCLGIFVVGITLTISSPRQKLLVMGCVVVTMLMAGSLVFSRARSDRLMTLEDASRATTYMTAWDFVQSRPLDVAITGPGYGSWWPWYLAEVDDTEGIMAGQQNWTPYGPVLYHPHSTVLLLVVELGAVGILLIFIMWRAFGRTMLEIRGSGRIPILATGVVASGFSMFFDLYLFRSPIPSALWWIFVFGLFRILDQRPDDKQDEAIDGQLVKAAP